MALFFVGDSNHAMAAELWRDRRVAQLSTNHVLGKTWTFLRRRRGHADAVRAVDAIEASPGVSVVRVPDDAEDEAAWEWLRLRDDREYLFVDATSFAVCAADGCEKRWLSTATSPPQGM